ncbi:TPA: hypothetical protein LTV79_002742 [Clostridioides difficile]|nr:hypothetical protein [Clostridioides difficile]HBL8519546.1 hypothetical protein [Clostridioides difficile]
MEQSLNETSKLIKKLANDRYTLYREVNQELSKGGIVLFGDSLAENFPINELYSGSKRILNRGIFGSTTYDVINRLDDIVNVLKPDTAIIWVGTNDFMPIVPHNSETEVSKRIIQIADLIKMQSRTTKILILSLLPVNTSSHSKIYHEWLIGKDNDKLKNTNEKLETLCIQKKYKFLDFFNLFCDKEKQLQLNYTIDGTHINYAAYKIIFDKLLPFLQ